MKKIFAVSTLALTLGIGAVSLTGCPGSTPWPPPNVVQQIQGFESTVQIGLNGAQVAWTFIQPYLPPAQLTQLNQTFETAVAATNHALSLLNDALTAALAAQQPMPDFTALMTAVSDAFSQVLALIVQFTSTSSDAGAPDSAAAAASRVPANVPGLADAQAASVHLKAFLHH